ncbi:FtsX-like permease family protein [Kocuria carniphila]|uniref:FtsX-like permease family protein n=1 Tax=Kocuria carniphila TaxID=262208 RepID=UPI0034CDFB66
MRQLILTGAWAHRGAMVGTTVAIALAAALVAISGVLVQTGFTGQDETGMLTALAGSFGGTVLLAAILVVTSTVGLALRGRQRDFSLLRAVGATRRQVREIVAAEVLVALIAIPVGAVLGMTGSVFLQPLLTASGLLPTGGGLAFGVLPVAGALITMVPAAGLPPHSPPGRSWLLSRPKPSNRAVPNPARSADGVGSLRSSWPWWVSDPRSAPCSSRAHSVGPARQHRRFSWWEPRPWPVPR